MPILYAHMRSIDSCKSTGVAITLAASKKLIISTINGDDGHSDAHVLDVRDNDTAQFLHSGNDNACDDTDDSDNDDDDYHL